MVTAARALLAGGVLALATLAPATRAGAQARRPAAAPRAKAQPPAHPSAMARERELMRVKEERATLETQLRSLRATAGDIREARRLLDAQADATARLVAALDRQLAEIGADALATTRRLTQVEARLASEQGGLRRRLVEIYKRGPLYEAEVLLSARSLADLVTRYKYLHEVTSRDRARVARVQALRDTVEGQRTLLARLQVDLARNRIDQAAEEARLRGLGAERARALADIETRARRAESRLAEIARDERRLSAIIAAAEDARRRAELRAARIAAGATNARIARSGVAGEGAGGARAGGATASSGGAAPPAARGPSTSSLGALDWPVDGRLLYRFGRAIGTNNTVTRWNGIGIAASSGTPVRAVAAGRVVIAEPVGTYGLTVILQHGAGDYSVYGSLARADVARGAEVAKGAVVGTVGAADPDLPAHLHFEVRPGGQAVDPLGWLRGKR